MVFESIIGSKRAIKNKRKGEKREKRSFKGAKRMSWAHLEDLFFTQLAASELCLSRLIRSERKQKSL